MVKKTTLRLIKFYQRTSIFHLYLFRILFLTDKVCRFIPSCSEYTYQAVERYGVVKGLFLGFKRVIGCHPWSKGGLDPVL
jgi:putative membrane protein insertion efficiency factor